MKKILLAILAFLIFTFIITVMLCAMVVAGRSDEYENNRNRK